MTHIDEGVSLKQLIPLYIKYRIPFYVLDFRYHMTRSHNDYNYTTNTNYVACFYLIDGGHLYPVTNKHDQMSISPSKKDTNRHFHKDKVQIIERDVYIMEELSDRDDEITFAEHDTYKENTYMIFQIIQL